MGKTREIATDFRKRRTHTQPLSVQGKFIKVVEGHKYLAIHSDSRLNWKTCKQEGGEQILLPEKAEILQCVQQNVGHFISVCGCHCTVHQHQ